MKKLFAFGILLASLSSFASAQKAGDFVFVRNVDLITDDDTSYFYAAALNSEESSSYSPKLFIGCRYKKPYIYVNARARVNPRGEAVPTRIRFDQQKPSELLSWQGSSDDSYVVNIPTNMQNAFIKQGAKSQQVVIQFNEDVSQQFQFGLNKLDFMLSKLVCGKELQK